MKRSLFFLYFLLAAIFPLFAQEEVVPVESLTLKKDKIPPDVLKAAEQIFKENTQVKWASFPYELKKYGWVVDQDYKDPLDHYVVEMKTKDGKDVYAVFEPDGELVRYRIVDKNAPIPMPIINDLSKNEYKDWTIVKGIEKVTDNQNKVEDHYIVKVEKNNKKRNLYYTLEGERLVNN